MNDLSIDDRFIDIACGDECGAAVMVRATESAAGWVWLDVRRAWRCPACNRALVAVRDVGGGNDENFVDRIPASSRGALPKETASTISPSTVANNPTEAPR